MRTSISFLLLGALLTARLAAAQAPSCQFGPGALPAETLPPGTPHGDAIPIQHIVLFMQENRSFDEYFSQLKHAGQPKIDVAKAKAQNVDPTGATSGIKRFKQKMLCEVADLD